MEAILMFKHQKVTVVAKTEPMISDVKSADEFIAYVARVSNPGNQLNTETAPKLIQYLIKNKHWSPFELVNVVMEIKTTRDIGRQILRHRSFAFQEFSQRYAEVTDSAEREARLQDTKNRQNSIDINEDNDGLVAWWDEHTEKIASYANAVYVEALRRGIAKEQARVVLPEGLTMSTLYMAGSLRSWIHYIILREKNGTQKEHMDIAQKCKVEISKQFPSINWEELQL